MTGALPKDKELGRLRGIVINHKRTASGREHRRFFDLSMEQIVKSSLLAIPGIENVVHRAKARKKNWSNSAAPGKIHISNGDLWILHNA